MCTRYLVHKNQVTANRNTVEHRGINTPPFPTILSYDLSKPAHRYDRSFFDRPVLSVFSSFFPLLHPHFNSQRLFASHVRTVLRDFPLFIPQPPHAPSNSLPLPPFRPPPTKYAQHYQTLGKGYCPIFNHYIWKSALELSGGKYAYRTPKKN